MKLLITDPRTAAVQTFAKKNQNVWFLFGAELITFIYSLISFAVVHFLFYMKEANGVAWRAKLDLSYFDEQVTLSNIKWCAISAVVFAGTWIALLKKPAYSILLINLASLFYLSNVALTNYAMAVSPQTYWITCLLQCADSFHICIYLFMTNSYLPR